MAPGRPHAAARLVEEDGSPASKLSVDAQGEPGIASERQKHTQESKAIRARHGITDAEYKVLLGRIMAAGFIVRRKLAAPPDKKADVDIVQKHWDRIQAAESRKR